MRFIKAHGLGNDFVIVDDRQNIYTENLPALARKLCHRRTGIGADGLMFARTSDTCDAQMQLFNSDGSVAPMCGNGVRCFAKFVHDTGIVPKESFSVDTLAGKQLIELTVKDGAAVSARVNLGKPERKKPLIPMLGEGECVLEKVTVGGKVMTFSAILLGNPHAVVFVDEIPAYEDLCRIGHEIEHMPMFPIGANINFTRVIDSETVEVRTWERGCGATYACGTGSSSAAVCSAIAGFTGRHVKVRLMLGTLDILWDADGSVYMDGPAEFAFEGEVC
ncbi:MAG TPA: diaminopimelate epimerase [Clostridia bacterium]|nr:diaminopimelate epimerase [Clostridia bacterium]